MDSGSAPASRTYTTTLQGSEGAVTGSGSRRVPASPSPPASGGEGGRAAGNDLRSPPPFCQPLCQMIQGPQSRMGRVALEGRLIFRAFDMTIRRFVIWPTGGFGNLGGNLK